MKETKLWMIWGGLFLLSAGFGFLPNPNGLLKAVMVLLALGFFVPPALFISKGSRKNIRRVRILSFIWLSVTLVLLVVNFLSVGAPKVVGNVAYGFMVVLSAPMVCGQYWVISLFLWACIMLASSAVLKRKS